MSTTKQIIELNQELKICVICGIETTQNNITGLCEYCKKDIGREI